MIKAYIDRIEDGKTAVVIAEKSGQLLVPVKSFPFEVYEGMHLSIEMKPDPKSEKKTRDAVIELREKLLKKSQKSS